MSDPAAAQVRLREISQSLDELAGLLLALELIEKTNSQEILSRPTDQTVAAVAIRGAILRVEEAAGCETTS